MFESLRPHLKRERWSLSEFGGKIKDKNNNCEKPATFNRILQLNLGIKKLLLLHQKVQMKEYISLDN